jgi:hypothetical protein
MGCRIVSKRRDASGQWKGGVTGWQQCKGTHHSRPQLENIGILEQRRTNKKTPAQALMAHTCNPSYSGGREQED